MNYKDGLDELRNRYQKGEVSALIGAGFSKNVYSDYPSWDELLKDMVKELYQSEIDTSFLLYLQSNNNAQKFLSDKQNFENNKIKEIIIRDGYLNIVSKYIEHNGIRESIENYIEERIPYIDESKNNLVFGKTGKKVDYKISDFKIHSKLLEGSWNNIYTTNYDRLLEYSSKILGKEWNVVKNAYEISFLKAKNSIIKLHGDLYNPSDQNKEYVFDGNYHQRYVISKSDYEKYPKEHEAFTQLMRISLLQGTFCLLGFSGNDPNFIAWIDWVRDILAPNLKQANEKVKVFLIDVVSDGLEGNDKYLFYKNHKTVFIPLNNDEIKTYIEAPKGCNDAKILLEHFFNFINNRSRNPDIDGIQEVNEKDKYQFLWQKLYTTKTPFKDQWPISSSKILEYIKEQKKANRIVKNVDNQKKLIEILSNSTDTLSNAEIDSLLIAFKDSYNLTYYYSKLLTEIKQKASSKSQIKQIDSFLNRNASLRSPQQSIDVIDDESEYERILRLAFLLDFKSLKYELLTWNPNGTYIQKKALFLYFFDKNRAKSMLLDFIDNESNINERYYATELLNLINNAYPMQYSTTQYENQNIDGLYDYKNELLKDLINDKKDVNAYGHRGKTISFGRNYIGENSLRFLQFMIEFPVFPSFYNFWSFLNDKDWYAVFKNINEEFPYPTLFYSILCTSSKEILSRIGQDFSYSEKLYENKDIAKMLDIMLSSLLSEDVPRFLKGNIFEIAKELFVSVAPAKWESKFVEIWEKLFMPNYKDVLSHQEFFRFLCKALHYVKSKDVKNKIIIDCLIYHNSNIPITIELFANLQLTKSFINDNSNLKNYINSFVDNINNVNEFSIAVSIYQCLSQKNINTINIKIKNIIKGKSIDRKIIHAVCCFSKTDKDTKLIAKRAILDNKQLWDTGIMNRGEYTDPQFIQLSRYKTVLKWNKQEIVFIFERLKESLNNILEKPNYEVLVNNFFIDIKPLFDEMLAFLIDNRSSLEKEKDYFITFNQLDQEIKEIRGFVSVDEAFLSDDSNKILNGLQQLYIDISSSGIENNIEQIKLLIDRIAFKKKEEISSCLSYTAYYLTKFSSKDIWPSELLAKISFIPRLYTIEVLKEMKLDIPNNAKYIINISKSLDALGIKSEYIDYWLSIKRHRRYNNL